MYQWHPQTMMHPEESLLKSTKIQKFIIRYEDVNKVMLVFAVKYRQTSNTNIRKKQTMKILKTENWHYPATRKELNINVQINYRKNTIDRESETNQKQKVFQCF